MASLIVALLAPQSAVADETNNEVAPSGGGGSSGVILEVCDLDWFSPYWINPYGRTWQEYAWAKSYPGPDNQCEYQWYYVKIMRLGSPGGTPYQVGYDSDQGGLDPSDGLAQYTYTRNCGFLYGCSGYRTHHWSSFYWPAHVRSIGLF